jgi:4-hydroxy-3-methylbut-2-enyl diphosphate reductase
LSIEVAKHAGFCSGVRSAVNQALETARVCRQKNLACRSLGPLINNPDAVKALEKEGLIAVEQPKDAKGCVLIIRSHGVTEAVYNEALGLALEVIDCTCPFVKRLHETVENYSKDGLPIVLIGDRRHPEVIGTAGWCKGQVHFVENIKDVNALPPSCKDALVVSQTTFRLETFKRLVEHLKLRFPGILVSNTICSATKVRQEEARELATRSDRMIVVGGKNSANTRKLFETCLSWCPNTILVERAADLPSHCRPSGVKIGITAGASTPDWSLKEVVITMNDIEKIDQMTPESVEEQAQEPVQQEAIQEETAQEEAVPVEAVQEEAIQKEAAEEEPVQEEAIQEEVIQEEVIQEEVIQEEAVQGEPIQEEAQEPKEQAPKGDMHMLQEAVSNFERIRTGQTLEGKVVLVGEDEISVNIDYKADGLLKKSDMVDEDVQVGDTIEVEIIRLNDGEGNVILSQRNIVNKKLWAELVEKYETGEYVEGIGKQAVKGGLIAFISNVRTFIPASHLARHYVENVGQFVGQTLKLKIIELDNDKKRLVASRKLVLEEEKAKAKAEVWARLAEGDVVKGIVRRFTNFGAFVDLGGVDGLIHITDISWNRNVSPRDVFKENQEVDVLVLALDPERERISLGYKQLQPTPWDDVEEKYPVGSILVRKVVRIRPFGAFIELEPGVDGLCHISQVSVNRINKVEDVLKPGQEVAVKVLNVDPDAKRISLSIREAMEDPSFDYSTFIPGDDLEEEPVEEQGEEVETPVKEQVEEPTEEVVEEPAEEPVEEPTEEQVEEPVEEPAEEVVEEPAKEPVEEPAEEPAEEPVEEPAEEVVEEPVEEQAPEAEEKESEK